MSKGNRGNHRRRSNELCLRHLQDFRHFRPSPRSQTADSVAHRQRISRDLLNLALCHVDFKLKQSRSSESEQVTHVVEEAARHRGGAEARGDRGLHGAWAVPTPCVHQRPPRPVQTGGGRSVTPSSTQLVTLGRLLLFGWSGRPSSSWSPLLGGCQPLRCRSGLFCSAQFLGKTATLVPSRWSFARRHMLGTGELM